MCTGAAPELGAASCRASQLKGNVMTNGSHPKSDPKPTAETKKPATNERPVSGTGHPKPAASGK